MMEKTIYVPISLVVNRISNKPVTRDPIVIRNVAKRAIARRRKAMENPVAEITDRKSTVTRLTRMKEVLVMTTAINTIGGRVEPTVAKRKTVAKYSKEIDIPKRTVPVETRPPHFRNVRNNRMVVVISTRMIASVTREDTGASSG